MDANSITSCGVYGKVILAITSSSLIPESIGAKLSKCNGYFPIF
jgi:hypothetical protein